jgi:predicted  nucleic acid-binding Zn-ribbon protein
MIFRRTGVCSVCGCRITVERFESLAKVLKRLDEMRQCPECGCVVRWQDTKVPVERITVRKEALDAS